MADEAGEAWDAYQTISGDDAAIAEWIESKDLEQPDMATVAAKIVTDCLTRMHAGVRAEEAMTAAFVLAFVTGYTVRDRRAMKDLGIEL
jgi:hypothetical protein